MLALRTACSRIPNPPVMCGHDTAEANGVVDRPVEDRNDVGETATVPAGSLHFRRNDTDDEVHAIEFYQPALQMQQFFEVLEAPVPDSDSPF